MNDDDDDVDLWEEEKTILREKNVRNGTLTKRCVYVFGLEFIIGHFEDRWNMRGEQAIKKEHTSLNIYRPWFVRS